MAKIRYRYGKGATAPCLTKLHHINRLGNLRKVRGYRFGQGVERVMVYGENGTASYGGFCWGYGGEGPRGLVKVLTTCGLTLEKAKAIAFESIRRNEPGTDWEVDLTNG